MDASLTTDDPDGRLVARLAAELAAVGSGVGFVYRALAAVTEAYGLTDAMVVIDDPVIGRQAFRSEHRPIRPAPDDGPGLLPGAVLAVPAGLYAEPAAVDGEVAAAVVALCQVALQLDVSRHDASHDPLTGLYNRRSFDTDLERSASRSARYGWPFALALLDVDRFKDLNDRLGHHEGDQVLRIVGRELRRSLRAGDTAARVGGDEFGLILSNGGEQVAPLLERLERTVRSVVGVHLGFSAGVAVAPSEGTDPVDLYRLADRRLYDAKVSVS